MTFILGAVLFLLGAFFGMLIMAFASALPRRVEQQQEALVTQLRVVVPNE